MTQDTINAIASAYERAPHVPVTPWLESTEYGARTARSYRAFIQETIAQFQDMTEVLGIQIIPTIGTLTDSSARMFRLLDRESMLIVATDGAPFDISHPLDARHDNGLSLNTMFRAVHDFYGHYQTRAPFETFDGEVRAYRHHASMYSDRARAALFNETVAQLCYFYARGSFVLVQKACTLPEFENEVIL